jgi:predicted dehydrogenase
MKLVVASAGEVKVVDVPVPICRDNEVLVKTSFSLISTGTETWTIEATEPKSTKELLGNSSTLKKAINLTTNAWKKEGTRGVIDYIRSVRNPQEPLGYSLSGIVVEVGKNVPDIVPGDRVACAGEGKAFHAEYASVGRNLIAKVPIEVELRDAAFTTLGAIALHGFRRSMSNLGDAIAVIGVGLVGNLIVQIAKSAGCKVVAIDQRADRLELARKVGADAAFSSEDDRLSEHLLSFTNGRGLDSVIVCASTTSDAPANLASRIARDRGRITVVGRVGMNLQRKDLYQKELEMAMSRSLGPGRYDPLYEEGRLDYPVGYVRWTLNRNMEAFIEQLRRKTVSIELLTGGTFLVEDARKAYEALSSGSKVAVLLSYGSSVTAALEHSLKFEQRGKEGRINVALVGPGNYAKEIVLPLLRMNSSLNLRWLVSSNPLHARQIAERYHFERSGTDYGEALEDDALDVVFITAPNSLHHEMVIRAANTGKIVFVEKPLCLTDNELQEIIEVQARTGARIVVGFNRRYAPLIRKTKEILGHLDGPFVINYRVNADYIPPSRWVQDPELGGGRIIAECCHFFDLFGFLLNDGNPSATVTCADVNGSTTVARDNLAIVLKYPKGSIASLSYLALGNRRMSRERMEVFGQGNVLVLEDFKSLKVYEASRVEDFSLGDPDKGHRNEFEELTNLVRGKKNSIVLFPEAVQTTKLSFEVERLARLAAGTSAESSSPRN